jgi:hypothetical protein
MGVANLVPGLAWNCDSPNPEWLELQTRATSPYIFIFDDTQFTIDFSIHRFSLLCVSF